jgi:hypothetical protein
MVKNILYISAVVAICLSACHRSQPKESATSFTKIDSLTESYLMLQDSLLHAWNVMVWDEQEKTKAMHSLLHLMHEQEGFDDQQLMTLEQRLGQLDRIRFTQKSLANSYVIEEYDFASNSLVSEILSLAEADSEFIENNDVQRLVDKVKIADQRVNDYRAAYDKVAISYNEFLEKYDNYLRDLDKDYAGEKRALFHMASD